MEKIILTFDFSCKITRNVLIEFTSFNDETTEGFPVRLARVLKIKGEILLRKIIYCTNGLAPKCEAPVVQRLDSAIQRINLYPLDSAIGFSNSYPLDSDLSGGYCYPPFEQHGQMCNKLYKGSEVRQDLGNRASPINRAHMKRP